MEVDHAIMPYNKIKKLLVTARSNIKTFFYIKIKNILSYSIKIFGIDYRIITDIILLSLDVVEKKLDLIFGKTENVQANTTNRIDKNKSVRKKSYGGERIKKISKVKTYTDRKFDFVKIFNIRIGKRIRRFCIYDCNVVLPKIEEKRKEKMETIKLKLNIKIFNVILDRILSAIVRFKRIKFWEVVQKRNRAEIVSGFLHIIYLSNEDKVELYQKELFEDIEIRYKKV